MPQIELSPETFARLQKYAIPFIDNPDTTVAKLIDFRQSHEADAPIVGTPAAVKHDLKHTSIISATVDGKLIAKPYWKDVLIATILAANKRVSKDELFDLIVLHKAKGKRTDAGFDYIPEAGLSIQGPKANYAWQGISHLATALKIPVKVKFRWQEHKDASRAGETDEISIAI